MPRLPARRRTAVDGRMPLVEHIRELRNRLAVSLLVITVGIIAAMFFWQPLLDFLKAPYCDTPQGHGHCQLYAFGPLEQFGILLKVSSLAGIVLTSPVWLYQLGAFITPALHPKEKRYAGAFLGSSVVLFGIGCSVAYLTLNKGLQFLLTVGGNGVTTLPSLKSYLNFVSLTLLAFGVAFLFPVVIVFLNVVGILPVEKMRAWRRGMIVAIAVFAAVITPSTDPYTFTFMAVPLYVLYEGCIVISRVRERAMRRSLARDPLRAIPDDRASPL